MTASVLCPEMQTSTHPILCSSTHWLHLSDTPPPHPPTPLILLNCQSKRLCWAVSPALANAAPGQQGEFWLSVDWQFLTALLRPLAPSLTRLRGHILITYLLHVTLDMQHVGRSVSKDADTVSELFRIHHNSTEGGGTEGSAIAVIRNSSYLCFSSPIAPPVCHCYVVLTLQLCSFVQFLLLPATNALFYFFLNVNLRVGACTPSTRTDRVYNEEAPWI